MTRAAAALVLAAGCSCPVVAQSRTMNNGAHRMEIVLERRAQGGWRAIDPGLVLDQGDEVRFRFRTNFDGYLYVSNHGTSGRYDQLFPRQETGRDNRVAAGQEYSVPATATAFRIAGPAGHEIVYWLVSPARLGDAAPRLDIPAEPHTLIPRCDDARMKARGDCVDVSAGPRLVPREIEIPPGLSDAAGRSQRDLMFMRQQDTAVISSPEPLTGPVIYEFVLAHR
jgi:Domain of unknown function (DUF4384)